MKKIFISQPMKDKTDDEIKKERKRVSEILKEKYGEFEILDSYFVDVPHEVRPLWFIGKSLEVLSNADVAVFTTNWDKYRGCKIENICAKEYGIEIIEM